MFNARKGGMPRPPIFRWLGFQALIVIVVALLFFWLESTVAGYSALLGGCIFLVPNAYFAIRAFQYSGARSAKQIVRSFYRGEAGKLILCAVLFTAAFKWIQPLDVAALFVTFAIMLVTNWLTPLLASGGTQRS